MSTRRPTNNESGRAPERASRARQRQRLIDACISALHIHGPSRTTVEKVVAIADMSPGIVRFYFDSKDAMLVASLAYLAAEFEQRVLGPLARLRETPVRALEQLVELYLDPDIASPRKVSVWYSFWGEASSRKEYYELCGRKDDDFAALVRDLIERVIAQSGAAHLDADAVALGLIGVLEILWQEIAFTDEAEIDRAAAKRRTFAYLRSVFPREFGGTARAAVPDASEPSVPAWAYGDGMLLTVERDKLFRPAWQLVGHEGDLPRAGDFLTADLAGERVLLIRDSAGTVRALRNSCRKRPHALVAARQGHLEGIECEAHGLSYGLDGAQRSGDTPGDLIPLQTEIVGGCVLVNTSAAGKAPPLPADWGALPALRPVGIDELPVAADWKLLVEQWLDALPRPKGVRRSFLPPNQLLESGPAGALVLQVIPEGPGKCRLRHLEFATAPAPARGKSGKGAGTTRGASAKDATGGAVGRAPSVGQTRLLPAWVQQDVEVAESTQSGLESGAGESDEAGPVSPALAQFRRTVAGLLMTLEATRR